MAEHTKGPWELGESRRGVCYQDVNSKDWSRLATVVTRLDGDPEDYPMGVANARLIASAPDMYDALQWLADEVEEPEALAVIRQALAKARGE